MHRLALLAPAALLFCAQTPAPAAAPPQLEFVFSELVTLSAEVVPGDTPYGRRSIVPITGGTFEGPNIRGTVMPGGWDWQLRRADGCLDIKADYFLRTDDGVVINIVNAGTLCRSATNAPRTPAYTQPRFEAPTGKYSWLSQGAFVGTLEPGKAVDGRPVVRIGIYRVR